MNISIITSSISLICLGLLLACSPAKVEFSTNLPEEFKSYWYQGQAELNSYNLEQARYGAIHHGKAVLIFVTEDFSEKKQVKLDNPQQAGKDAIKVMKLNYVKKFSTGIYPYSMMKSVFTPVNQQQYPHSLKVTTSSQEWCGHTFTQLNLGGNDYDVLLRSYFESEGDQDFSLKTALLEDEIWNIIRLNPDALPTGEIEIIPSTFYLRLGHKEVEVAKANASIENNGETKKYILDYPEYERTIRIEFQAQFPYKIMSWEETYQGGFGENAQKLTTKATLDETIQLDYWTHNSPADSALREKLNL
jgi:hypothetical protein